MADLLDLFRKLGFEQRIAAVAALLLAISTFGPFSFVEAGRADDRRGVLALAAGAWAGQGVPPPVRRRDGDRRRRQSGPRC
jgi:hypothetical protein